MITINFLEEEIAERRRRLVRKYALLGYALAWIFFGIIFLFNYQQASRNVNQLSMQLEQLKAEIDAAYPQLRHAMTLYGQGSKQKRQLTPLYETAFEPGFVIATFAALAAAIPENFWLQEVRFSEENPGGKPNPGRTLHIRGNLFFNPSAKNEKQIEKFRHKLQTQAPFPHADISVHLDRVQVQKHESRYYHNFELQCRWPESIL